MNTIYKSILVLGISVVSLNAVAQKDSTLTRQVLLERDYNPTLNEATKINTTPNILKPAVAPASSVKFLDEAPQLRIGTSKLGTASSGDIRTSVPFDTKRFYLNVGAGSNSNMDGVIGVRAVDTENDKLDIKVSHVSTDANVKYAHQNFALDKTKAKHNDTRANVNYLHKFDPSELTIGASYLNKGFNYYGNSFLGDKAHLDLIDLGSKQKVDVISFNAGLKARETNEGLLKYRANIAYTNFKTKYGFEPQIDKGPRGGIIEADVDFYTALGEGNIGIAGGILNQSFSSKKNYTLDDSRFGGYTNVTVNPYYKMEDVNWNITLGLNASYVNDNKNKFVVTPNVTAQLHLNEVNTLYAGVTGGVNDNTYVDILQENRYVNPGSKVLYSRTIYDAKIGFRSGVVPNLEFDIFAGYKQTKDDHMYTAHSIIDMDKTFISWSNVATPMYGDVSTGHVGGLLKTKLVPYTTLSAQVIGYFYNVKKAASTAEAWGKPNYTAELTADVKPIEKLTLSLSYLLEGGRKGYLVNHQVNVGAMKDNTASISTVDMKDINELNFRAEYQIVDWIAIHARVNNVLGQKYERHLGYTMQEINVLGGFNIRF